MLEFTLENTIGALLTAFFTAMGTYLFSFIANKTEVKAKVDNSWTVGTHVNFLILITLVQIAFWKSIFAILASLGGAVATIYDQAGFINSTAWLFVSLSHFVPNLIIVFITVMMLFRYKSLGV